MTLQQLEYIVAVNRYRHFAQAADSCNVTQPTLSAMIQKLEEELGVKIFDRKQQPIATTSAGKAVVEQAWQVLLEAKKLKEVVQEEQRSLSGTFTVGIIPTIAPYLIPRFFPQLMERCPQIDVRIVEMKTAHIKQALKHGDIDAGILALLDDMQEFQATPLFYEQFFAYVASSDRLYEATSVKSSDMAGEYLWLLDEGHCFRDQLVKFCQLKAATSSKKAYSLGSIETFMRMVESGKGITFIPELATLQLSSEQRKLVRPFAMPVPTRSVVMLTGKHCMRHSLVQLLVNEIRGAVPPDMLTLSHNQKKV